MQEGRPKMHNDTPDPSAEIVTHPLNTHPAKQLVTVLFPTAVIKQKRKRRVFNFAREEFQAIYEQLPEPSLCNVIRDRVKYSENRVFHALLEAKQQFIHLDKQRLHGGSPAIDAAIEELFAQVHDRVEASIWDGRWDVRMRNQHHVQKSPAEKIAQKALQQRIESRVQQIDNLQQLRQETYRSNVSVTHTVPVQPHKSRTIQTNSEICSPTHEPLSLREYKARKAVHFIHKLQSQQLDLKERIQRINNRRMEKQINSSAQRQQIAQQMRNEKKQLLRRRILKNKQIQQAQKQARQSLHEQYLKMLSSYEKPLYRKKEEEYRLREEEEKRKQLESMGEYVGSRASINTSQIKAHIARYNQIKEEKQYEREDAIELREKEFALRNHKYYKGKYHQSLTEREISVDTGRDTAIARKKEYSAIVRLEHAPQIDPRKQIQLQTLIERKENKRRKVHDRKYMEEGKKNLQQMHYLIDYKRAMNQLQVPKTPQPPKKQKYKDYLRDRQQEQQQHRQKAILKSKFNDSEELVLGQVGKVEESARRKEQYLRNAMDRMDFQQHMERADQIERQYIMAARAKAALLSQN